MLHGSTARIAKNLPAEVGINEAEIKAENINILNDSDCQCPALLRRGF